MEPFHVVSLAAGKLDQCRRRIQRVIAGRGPRSRPGLLHPRPCGGDLLIPQQRHRRPASLGPVRLRSNLHPRFSFRGRRPHHRPHHRQGHGRQPHRPETRRKKQSKPPNKQQPEPKLDTSQNRKQHTHEPCKEERKSQVGNDTLQKPYPPIPLTVLMMLSADGVRVGDQAGFNPPTSTKFFELPTKWGTPERLMG